jgi:hypothetical protein
MFWLSKKEPEKCPSVGCEELARLGQEVRWLHEKFDGLLGKFQEFIPHVHELLEQQNRVLLGFSGLLARVDELEKTLGASDGPPVMDGPGPEMLEDEDLGDSGHFSAF